MHQGAERANQATEPAESWVNHLRRALAVAARKEHAKRPRISAAALCYDRRAFRPSGAARKFPLAGMEGPPYAGDTPGEGGSFGESEAVRVHEPVDLEDSKASGARRGDVGHRFIARFGPHDRGAGVPDCTESTTSTVSSCGARSRHHRWATSQVNSSVHLV